MIFEGKKILVTGGTGSMGKTFVRRVLSGGVGTPKKLIVFSRDEAKQHDMRVSYLSGATARTDEVIYRNFLQLLEFRIGDVRSFDDVSSAVKDADIVVHAAALKQVPACEYFPEQAVLTNCIGVANVIRSIREHSLPVESVIAISTDKACKPVNVMGMTKALQERLVISANVLNPATRFICCRYGNVLASRGSVIPLFHEQIRAGGPVTITDERMTRFLLSLEQAVDTVIEALRNAQRGETYVPSAPGAKVINIARALIGKRSIDIQMTGVRPGEKFDEVLVSEEEINHTIKRGNYYVIRPMLPELGSPADKEPRALKKEFSSGDSVLDYDGTVALLSGNRLMMDDDQASKAELLR